MVLKKMNSYLVSGNEAVTSDCSEALDRANTAEQELGSLIRELRTYAQRLRDRDFEGVLDPEHVVVEDVIADAIEDIINGD